MRRLSALRGLPFALLCLLCLPFCAWAGNQQYEPLSASVQAALSGSIADRQPPRSSFKDYAEAVEWLSAMSGRLAKRIPNQEYRLELLRAVHYEATRAGLDPQLVLGLIQVESGFRKYAVSSAGAKGYMQVMPFWVKVIGQPQDNLFHMRTNLRYGCTILRHYLDIEKGNLFRALGRYNGSLGRAEYPNMVNHAWAQWRFERKTTASGAASLPKTAPSGARPKPEKPTGKSASGAAGKS
jgi:soluble lytic murein transglycosylase-like protein